MSEQHTPFTVTLEMGASPGEPLHPCYHAIRDASGVCMATTFARPNAELAHLLAAAPALLAACEEAEAKLDRCEQLICEWYKPAYQHGHIYGGELRSALGSAPDKPATAQLRAAIASARPQGATDA